MKKFRITFDHELVQTWVAEIEAETKEKKRLWKFGRENIGVELSNQWDNFPTVAPVCGRDDGISSRLDGITFPKWRNESIKAYGNAIVPQVAYQIFKTINQIKNQ